MDGTSTGKSDQLSGIRSGRTRLALLTVIGVNCLLSSLSGCAITGWTLMTSRPEAGSVTGPPAPNATSDCQCPSCAVPKHAVAQHAVAQHATVQTQPTPGIIMVQPVPQPWSSAPPPAATPLLQTQALPTWSLAQPVADDSVSAVDLSLCQKKMEEMNHQISSLTVATERAHHAMSVMAVEQKKLQRQNDDLQRRADSTDRQYLESMDSLSQIISEVISPNPELLTPVPASSVSVQKSDQNLREIPLPAVD